MDYQVFISYKCTDEYGRQTLDSAMAQDLYNILSKIGYKVFFSSDTLEKLGSSQYKTTIDTALDSAKVMIVVLSNHEYATTHWVQYEWDSFYNDYLSGVRKDANLFTLTQNVQVNELPRTLRNVQNFDYSEGVNRLCEYVKNILPLSIDSQELTINNSSDRISIITGKEVTINDIREAVMLDSMVYDDIYHVDTTQCEEWYEVNPDIYIMAKDNTTGRVIAYINVSPVTDECYERLKRGDFIDTGITAEMLLSYDMPFPYSVNFSSIVIHPNYQNSEVFMKLFNAIIDKFIFLGSHEVYVKRMIADAVTKNGEKFCRLFGMKRVKGSNHDSTLYEVTLIPPEFRIMSKKAKELYDYYNTKYNDAMYLFEDCDE